MSEVKRGEGPLGSSPGQSCGLAECSADCGIQEEMLRRSLRQGAGGLAPRHEAILDERDGGGEPCRPHQLVQLAIRMEAPR